MVKILMIEDDLQIQDMYREKLILEGFKVYQAESGKKALELMKTVKPNLIILDIMLSGKLNGFDVLEHLKADKDLKKIPVIMLTNLSTEKKVAFEIGAADYLIKADASLNEIVEKIKNLT